MRKKTSNVVKGRRRGRKHRRQRIPVVEYEAALTHAEEVREADAAYRAARREYHRSGVLLHELKGA